MKQFNETDAISEKIKEAEKEEEAVKHIKEQAYHHPKQVIFNHAQKLNVQAKLYSNQPNHNHFPQ